MFAPHRFATPLVVALSLAPLAFGQGAMEEFEEVDPWTEGDPEKLEALGYEAVGRFGWVQGERTEDVQKTMGGADALWVETEHFKIGSSLNTYRMVGDRDEKAKLDAEFKALKEKLGRFKAPKKDLDPWLRLHLWALRAEQIYDDFVADFGLPDGGARETGPYLGQEKKFYLLITERKSELGRYLRAYETGHNDYAFRTGSPERGMFFGLNAEAVRERFDLAQDMPIDSMLHNMVADSLARNFVDGFDQNWFAAPPWLATGVGIRHGRRVDPRWTQTGKQRASMDEEHWEWTPRVKDFVDNDYSVPFDEYFAWDREHEWKEREMMIAWSKVEFLLDEAKGDRTAFLAAMVAPPPFDTETGQRTEGDIVARQNEAFESAYGKPAAKLEDAWQKWAKKKRRKKKRKH